MKYSVLKAHLNAAKGYAKLSHAQRLKVGAVLVKDGRVISIGYNGTPSGGPNECEYWIEGVHEKQTKPEVIHAEANCILFAAKNGTSTNDCALVTTDSPCFVCATMIIQSGIKELYYEHEYRDVTPLKFLQEYGIKTQKVEI